MAMKVPTVREPTVRQAAMPGALQRIDLPSEAFGSANAEAAMRNGQRMQQAGEDLGDIAIEQAKQQTAVQVLDYQTRFEREVNDFLYEPQNGLLTRKGGSALGAQAETAKRLETMKKSYLDSVKKNPALATILNERLTKLGETAVDLAQRHEFGEFQTYKLDTLNSRAKNNADTAFLNWNDDSEFNKRVAENDRLLIDAGNAGGWDAETRKLKRSEMVSGMVYGRVKAALAADKSPDTILAAGEWAEAQRLKGNLNSHWQETDALLDAALPVAEASVALRELGGYGGLENIPIEKLAASQYQQESGGQQMGGPGSVAGPNQPTTSNKGAVGIAQILPGTGPEAAALAGVAWDETKFRTDADYNAKLGQAYLQQQKNSFGGSTTLALMAYNAGPGAVRDFMDGTNKTGKNPNGITLGDPVKGETTMQQFVARFPFKETRDYVRRINNIANAGDAQAVTFAAVQQRALELEAKRPGAGKALLSMYDDQIKVAEAAKKAEQTAFLDTVIPQVQAANGDYTVLKPEEIAKATELGVMDKLTEWKGVTAPAWKTKLTLMSSDELAQVDLSDPDIRLSLSIADRDAFAKEQAKIINGAEGAGTRDQVLKVGKLSLIAAGIDPTPKDDDPAGAQELLKFVDAANRQVEIFRAENGKGPTPEQLRQITDSLVLGGTLEKSNKPGWIQRTFGTKEKSQSRRGGRAFEAKPGELFYTEIPNDEMIEALQKYSSDKVGLAAIAAEDPSWIENVKTDAGEVMRLNENGLVRLYTQLRKRGLSDEEILFYGP